MDSPKRRKRTQKNRRLTRRQRELLDKLVDLLRRQPVERQEQLLRELESGRLADGQEDETKIDPNDK